MDSGKLLNEVKQFLNLDKENNLVISYKDDISSPFDIYVCKKGNKINIVSKEKVGLFYSLTLLKQNENKDNFEIKINKKFDHNGSMFDCSRNAVLNINKIKEILLMHALMGLNRFMLYTEDIYQIEGEPYFGYLRGRYSKEELKEIVEYGSALGIDVVPCIQTLSHLNQAIRWSNYGKIADSNLTLDIEKEEIYTLIEKMIKTLREVFNSSYIHIGMDEAWDLGLSHFLAENRVVDKKEYFLRHLNRVVELCKKYDFKPMMWCDMFFKIDPNKSNNWFEYKGFLDTSIKKQIPDVELIYWNYYYDDINVYLNNLKTILDTDKPTCFAGGFIRWLGQVPNITPSIINCSVGLKASIKRKIKDVFLTTWGDNNSGSAVNSYFVGLAVYSCFDYSNGSEKNISKLLKTLTGLSLEKWKCLELPNKINEKVENLSNSSMFFFYQDPLLGLFDTRVKDSYKEKYHNDYLTLQKLAKRKNKYNYVFKAAAAFTDFLSYKVCLGKDLRYHYQNKDLTSLKNDLLTIKLCIKKLDIFINDYRSQWFKDNKPFGFEINDGRLGYLKQRLCTAFLRVNDYLLKKIDIIPELEETILPYNGTNDDENICENAWGNIVTAGNII